MNKVVITLVSLVIATSVFAKGGGGGHASAAGHASVSTAHVSVAEPAHVTPAVSAARVAALKAPVAATRAAKETTPAVKASNAVETAKVRPVAPVFVHAGKTTVASPASAASGTKTK